MKPETMMIDDVRYVREDSLKKEAKSIDGKPFVICRSTTASPYFGYLESDTIAPDGKSTVVLIEARRIYEWYGAAGLQQLAESGTAQPTKCKFTPMVKVKISNVHEILYCTETAKKSLEEVKEWKL
jgi:hypothetical protein